MASPRTWRASWQPILVWVVWLGMLANAIRFVATYGSDVMFMDDLALMEPLLGPDGLTGEYLWVLHNEHRVPLPKLIQYALYVLTHDVRSGSYFSVCVLALSAWGAIQAARTIRGRSIVADAFFPLILLHTGNCENLLMGFQLALMLVTALVTLLLIVTVTRADAWDWKRALVASVVLVSLPLCGGPGLVQTPVLAIWLASVARKLRRRESAASQRAGFILWNGVFVTAAVVILYMVAFRFPEGSHRGDAPLRVADHAVRVLVSAFGPAGGDGWPWTGWLAVLVMTATAVLVITAWRADLGERARAGGLGMCLLANLCVPIGIAMGRGGGDGPIGFAIRYVGLTAPAFIAAYFAWTLYGKPLPRAIAQGGLCASLAIAFCASNHARGEEFGALRRQASVELKRDIAAGVPGWKIVETYSAWVDPDPVRMSLRYAQLARTGLAPFDDEHRSFVMIASYPMFDARPSRVTGIVKPDDGSVDPDRPGLLAAEGANLYFHVPDGARKVRGYYGVPRLSDHGYSSDPVQVLMLLRSTRGPQKLFERTLDPAHSEADRGSQRFELELPEAEKAEVVLRILRRPEYPSDLVWGWWSGVGFE